MKKVYRIMFFWNGFMKFKWFEDEVIELIKIVFIVSLIIMNFWIFYFNVFKKKENSYCLCRNNDVILCKLLFFFRMINLRYKLRSFFKYKI